MKVIKIKKNKKIEEVTQEEALESASLSRRVELDTDEQTSSTKYLTLPSDQTYKKKNGCRFLLPILFIFFVLLIVGGVLAYNYVYLPYSRIKASVNDIEANANALLESFDNKDLSNIDTQFLNIKSSLTKVNTELDQFEFLATFEYTKGYYDNFQVIRRVLDKTSSLMDSTLPDLKNLLKVTGFKVEKDDQMIITQIDPDGSAEEEDSAFSLVMKELPQYLALYETIEPKIIDIFDELEQIDPAYIPQIGGAADYTATLAKINDFAVEFPALSAQTIDFLRELPTIIGSTEPARYLLILQNETEMRASGGLLTAFGTLQMNNGEISDINLTDMWNLETYVSYDLGIDVGYRNIYGQHVLMERGCGAWYLRAQDAGIYPDLKLTMNMLSDYYDYANMYNPAKFPDYEYILLINNHFAETLVSLLEPLEVEGFGLVTAEGLYDFIKAETDAEENMGSAERKSIIKEIANAAREKFLQFEFKDFPNIIKTMIQSIQAKDIAIIAPNNNNLESYLEKYGFTGETVKDYNGDYFQLSEAQNCSLKINRWLRNEVTQTINIDTDGNITKQVDVKWWQPEIYQDAYYGQYDLSGNFSYRAWVRIFMPDGSGNINSNGYAHSGYLYYRPQEYYDDEMNKYISDNIIQFDHRRESEADPIPEQSLSVSYMLPDNLNYNITGNTYRLLVQKHPGKSWGEKNTIILHHDGAEYKVEFELDRDKVITYSDGIITVDNYNKSLDFILNLVDKVPWDKTED